MSKRLASKIIVQGNRPFIHEDGHNEYIIYNSELLKDKIPAIHGRQFPFGCKAVPVFINGEYPFNVEYQLEGYISGGYHTVAIISIPE